jgi:two-component system nitrate/nitrite response regulator NarL
VTRVAICDFEPIAIEGLRALLESEGLPVVAGETTLREGMDAVQRLEPSLLIVDKALGMQPVTEWIAVLRKEQPKTAIMVWSASISEPEVIRLLQAGAHGVVRKTAPIEDVMSCIRSVAAGGTWMDAALISDASRPVQHVRSALTVRETQVMDLIQLGMRNKEIGVHLGIQTGTVKIHMKHIFEKTGIRGRYGLALSGLKEKGLLTLVGE